jgi:NADPH-dependent 2,4-dienoyl-CoA reductase/sulfur reductase-like enzyme
MRRGFDITRTDILIVGAGPAGMTTATTARRFGLSVIVVDDQPGPGGQIWRAIENGRERDDILGPAYSEGRPVSEAFRASGAVYLAGAQLWQIEPGFHAFITLDGSAQIIAADSVILATGAQERPVPFPGWTLPGVLTVGAAQILLKSAGQIPDGPVWIAGSGPLPLLYAVQLLQAGGQIAGYLDTTPPGQWRKAASHLPAAMRGWRDLAKGVKWMAALRRSGTQMIKGITQIEAQGEDRITALRYRTAQGADVTVPARTLLVHEGVVPNIHAALSLGCDVSWNAAQDCFVPNVDGWGETSVSNLFIAGDGAGIAGAKAATLRGELAALRIAAKQAKVAATEVSASADAVMRKLNRELAIRPFIDAMFRPRPEVFAPVDETIVCRCEEVTAGQVRALAKVGRPGPNQIKTATRAGMGPCQGRQCGYTLTRILSAAQCRSPEEVGFLHIRPPLKPITLGQIASLGDSDG